MTALDRIRHAHRTVLALAGWRRHAVACAAGATSVAALPPLDIWPVMFVTLPLLTLLLDGSAGTAIEATDRWQRARRAGMVGWWFGFGYFVLGLYWIGFSLLVEAEKFAWLLPFAVTLIPAGLALFYAAAIAVAGLFWRRTRSRVLVLAVAFAVAEWLRGHILTGFPWNALGYTLTADAGLRQGAAMLGIYGLTAIAVALFALPVTLLDAGRSWRIPAIAAAGLLVGLVAGRIGTPAVIAGVEASRVRLVQPNIAQSEKWDPANRQRLFDHLIDLSRRNGKGDVDDLAGIAMVVWPESSIPFLLLETPEALAAIAALLPAGTILVTGALRAEEVDRSKGWPLGWRVYNGILVLDDEARVIASYDKRHLVPFGEYLPLQDLLESIGLEQITRLKGGFAAGSGDRRLSLGQLGTAGPLVCYETIFPGEVAAAAEGASLLLNLTNDAWFGTSSGPYQHLHQARMRAIEQGLPMIRVANTGISALIAADGQIVASLGLGRAGTLDVGLPATGTGRPIATTYARYGDIVFFLLLAVAALTEAVLRRMPPLAPPVPRLP